MTHVSRQYPKMRQHRCAHCAPVSPRGQQGFTLIELMIVVVIIGILAALALPRFMQATSKSKQTEARAILKQVMVQQHAYFTEYETYWGNGVTMDNANPDTFARIGVTLMPPARYTYVMTTAASDFTCTATANIDDDATIDTWTINAVGLLQSTIDDAVN